MKKVKLKKVGIDLREFHNSYKRLIGFKVGM